MKSKDICKPAYCTGCEACASICPHKAISMKADWKGFKRPHIDSTKCTDCKLCTKTCPINTPLQPFEYKEGRVFIDKNDTYLTNASSGGAFGAIARHVLSQNGIVFGACMDEAYNINYIGVERIEDLKLLHGSKYVQSYVNRIYCQVKEELRKGRQVLFCGCPCQVAGLNKYLRKSYENLITMDLICHGVPSQPYFKDYVQDLLKEKKKNGITAFRFRWKKPLDSKEENQSFMYMGYGNRDYYMTYFLWGKGYRPSCYHCPFAGGERQGDFTIGDFWNNKVAQLPIDDSRGSSLILLNTDKAKQLEYIFKANGTYLSISTLHDAVAGSGGQLKHPCKHDIRCELIYILYKLFGLHGPKMLFKIEKLRFKL